MKHRNRGLRQGVGFALKAFACLWFSCIASLARKAAVIIQAEESDLGICYLFSGFISGISAISQAASFRAEAWT